MYKHPGTCLLTSHVNRWSILLGFSSFTLLNYNMFIY